MFSLLICLSEVSTLFHNTKYWYKKKLGVVKYKLFTDTPCNFSRPQAPDPMPPCLHYERFPSIFFLSQKLMCQPVGDLQAGVDLHSGLSAVCWPYNLVLLLHMYCGFYHWNFWLRMWKWLCQINFHFQQIQYFFHSSSSNQILKAY